MSKIDLEDLIVLNNVNGLNAKRLELLLEHFRDTKEILTLSEARIKTIEDLPKNIISNIQKAKEKLDLNKELALIKKHDVRLINFFDKEYPANLKDIYDPPILLYVKGKFLKEDELAIAIVGSRRASFYGLSTSQKLARELSGFGITIVSGLARGIDSAAHKGALSSKGRTIAVLGNGLSKIYPPENKLLAEKIIDEGVILSEFSMDTPPSGYNFPRRNRIISGLSLGTIVVEASKGSGALITARFALEQNREVFAVPGNVSQATSFGSNQLIKEGAKLVENVLDVIAELKSNIKDKLKKYDKESNAHLIEAGINLNLNNDEKYLYEVLDDQPKHIDEVLSGCKVKVEGALSTLTRLELKGLVRQLPGKMFARRII